MAALNTKAPSADAPEKALLFTQVQYYIVHGHGLDSEIAEGLATILDGNGAHHIAKASGQDNVPLAQITHIISATSDFPDYEDAISALKAVVKPDWVKASVAKGRLANPRQYSPDPRYFFSGLVVCCADLPSGDKDAIIGGVLAMGGLYSSAVTKMVTHIVALTTEPEKCQTALNKNLKCKIVLPHWFDDCLKLGKRIDEGPYCLPDPEILRKKPEDKIPDSARHDLMGASSIDPGRLITPSSSPSADRRELTVFKDKRVMLSTDLELGSHLLGTIEDLVHAGGGSVTGSVHKADMFICHYRESEDYQIASRAGCDVGNLAWLYHLITHNAWTSPLKRLLHYPIARNGLPGFKDFRISLSNYNGEARVYLENLAKAAGGEFTKTMKEDNTHLITAHTVSEKCDAAKEWNINMVNHLWLEESYAKWQIQSLANSRYTHFPSRTNLGEVVGQTPIDKQAIERVFFPKCTNDDHEMEHVSLPKPISTKDQNATSSKVPNSSGVHAASSANRDAVPDRTLQSDGLTPKAPKDRGRHSVGTELRTPAGPRYTDGKENDTPSTTGSRGAKDRAVAKLLDLAPDIALYEKESKRVGGVVFGGRKPSEEKGNGAGRKRSKSKDEDTEGDADEELRGAKKARKGREPASMRLLLTGDKRWVGQAKKESDERIQLRDLGILISQDPATCTHVASPHIVRTQKFACAMARAPIFLSANFVDQCLVQNKMLRADDYILNDIDGETRLGFKLADAVTRAKENKGRLLRGYNIYCTEDIRGGFDSYKSIVEANGAKCRLYRGRAGSIAVSRADGDDDYDVEEDYMYLISGFSPAEKKLWPKFRAMVQGVRKVPKIVRSDWALDLALRQEVKWSDVYKLSIEDVET